MDKDYSEWFSTEYLTIPPLERDTSRCHEYNEALQRHKAQEDQPFHVSHEIYQKDQMILKRN